MSRHITMAEHAVAFSFPLLIAAIHTGHHGCQTFSMCADESEVQAVVLALNTLTNGGIEWVS